MPFEIDGDKFNADARKGGIPYAFRQQFPALEVNDAGTKRRLRAFAEQRQRFISYIAKNEGICFSEAENLADAGNSPNQL